MGTCYTTGKALFTPYLKIDSNVRNELEDHLYGTKENEERQNRKWSEMYKCDINDIYDFYEDISETYNRGTFMMMNVYVHNRKLYNAFHEIEHLPGFLVENKDGVQFKLNQKVLIRRKQLLSWVKYKEFLHSLYRNSPKS
uniref:Transposase n=1 Tax=Rhabditophanes sp. KR3021 TaxID=114890 RepID=A0AC35TLR2_9BILA